MSRLPLLACCAVLSATFTGCAAMHSIVVQGNGSVERAERSVSAFEKITLSGEGEIVLQQGDREELTIETDSNLMEWIETEVDGNELKIRTKPGHFLRPSKSIRYLVTVRNLEAVTMSGSGSVSSEDLTCDKLHLSISGSADANLEGLDAKSLQIDISGSGKFIGVGKADEFTVKIAGSGKIWTKNMESKSVKVSVSGSAEIEVWATEQLNVNVAGSGTVRYKGDAKVKQSVAGSGSVSKID
ncbi:MAG: head GIN domain-containing protein [Gemmataceae bacterium]